MLGAQPLILSTVGQLLNLIIYYRLWMDGQKETHEGMKVDRYPNVHEQEDGTIFAVCATGTSSRLENLAISHEYNNEQ